MITCSKYFIVVAYSVFSWLASTIASIPYVTLTIFILLRLKIANYEDCKFYISFLQSQLGLHAASVMVAVMVIVRGRDRVRCDFQS